jgi:Putative cyclase
MTVHLPDYDALPEAPSGGRTGWGLFAEDPDVGLINLQTADRIAAAAHLVRRGVVFSLNTRIDFLKHPLFRRGRVEREWRSIGDIEFDDHLDNFYLQSSSQWDSLGHFGAWPGAFYNGARRDDVAVGAHNTIDHWAKRGIAGRAVVLDVVAALESEGRSIDCSQAYPITVSDLELARHQANIDYQPGDVLLLHTGYLTWLARLTDDEQRMLADQEDPPSPGLEHSEEMARYVWNTHASAIASDNTSVEVTPADLRPEMLPFGQMHRVLIGHFGMALGELWDLDELAADCAATGVYEGLLVSSPLFVPGGFGSPANAIVIK